MNIFLASVIDLLLSKKNSVVSNFKTEINQSGGNAFFATKS